MSVIICISLLAAGKQKAPDYLPSAGSRIELSQSDLPGFKKSRETKPSIVSGFRHENVVFYSLAYVGPKSNEGREAVIINLQVFQNAKASKDALSRRRQIYQAPSPVGSLTGMKYADEVDHEVAKNAIGIIAVKARYLIEVGLSFGDPIDKRKSVVDARMNARKLLVDQIAAKILARAAAQTWPDLGKHK